MSLATRTGIFTHGSMSRRVMEMSLAVPETVWISDIDVLRMNIEVFELSRDCLDECLLLELAYSLMGT